MPRIGLDRQRIIQAAVQLVEEIGLERFSMHALAASLGVKTASLYNHIEGVSEVMTAIGHTAVERFRIRLEAAEAGKGPKAEDVHDGSNVPAEKLEATAALLRIACAMRTEARKSPALYRVIMDLPTIQGGELMPIGKGIVAPIIRTLRPFARDEAELVHLTRAWRSMVHGFIAFEAAGYFIRQDVAPEESFRLMVDSFSKGLLLNDGRTA